MGQLIMGQLIMGRSNTCRLAVIPGDGIGKEVMPEGLKVLAAAAQKHRFSLDLAAFAFSSWDYDEKHGRMMPEDWKTRIGGHDAIFFGAAGMPDKIMARPRISPMPCPGPRASCPRRSGRRKAIEAMRIAGKHGSARGIIGHPIRQEIEQGADIHHLLPMRDIGPIRTP